MLKITTVVNRWCEQRVFMHALTAAYRLCTLQLIFQLTHRSLSQCSTL